MSMKFWRRTAAYLAISTEQPALLELRHAWAATRLLMANLNLLALGPATTARKATEKCLRELCEGIVNRLDRNPCPARLPETERSSVGEQIIAGSRPDVFSSQEPIELAETILSRADQLAELLLGELCLASKRATCRIGNP